MANLRRSYAMSHLPYSYEFKGDFFIPFVLGHDDAIGDNIANKPAFSEARGHYWLWKNVKFWADEFVSVNQYRRCFLFFPMIQQEGPFSDLVEFAHKNPDRSVVTTNRQRYIEYVHYVEQADKAPLNHWLDSVDMVFSRPLGYPRSIAQIYGEHHRAEDWEIFAQACRKRGYDDGRHNWLTGHLMFIMRPVFFNRYMTDWWDVMSEVDQLVQHESDPYQHRKIGYLTERFVSAWLLKMRTEMPTLRIQNLPIVEGLFQHDRPAPGVM